MRNFKKLAPIFLLLALVYVCLESFLKLLFSTSPPVFGGLLTPGILVSSASDDFWKLHLRMTPNLPNDFPHPLLGWIGDRDPDTLLERNFSEHPEKKSVFLFGDSFAACVSHLTCMEELFTRHEVGQRYILWNQATEGYGIDQIYLMTQRIVSSQKKPLVIFSFMTLDLDRTLLTLRPQQKPYFSLKDEKLTLHTPIPQGIKDFSATHPPEISSYLFALLQRQFFRIMGEPERVLNESERREKALKISERILSQAITLLKEKSEDFLVVVYHTNWPGVSSIDKDDWRDEFLRDFFTRKKIIPVWSKDLLRKEAAERSDARYFTEDLHPSPAYVQLIFDQIVLWLNSRSDRALSQRTGSSYKDS